jgi:hypothetical protein
MKHTEEQIIEKAKEILKDLDGKYYFEDCVNKATFKNIDESFIAKNMDIKGAVWSISIHSLADNLDFLVVSDETGEPLYYMNFNTLVFDIEKDEKGYFRVGLPRD